MSARLSDFGPSESVCGGVLGRQHQVFNAVSRQISEPWLIERHAT